jgi:hypothetical protein
MKMLPKNHILFEGYEAQWPKLDKPYVFDDGWKSANAKDDGAAYLLEWKISEEEKEELEKVCDRLYAEAAAAAKEEGKKWKAKPMYYPWREIEDGDKLVYNGKSKNKSAYGDDLTAPPAQKDAQGNLLPRDFQLTTGSKINIYGFLKPYSFGTTSGVQIRLKAIQVLELAPPMERASDDPFSATEGYTADQKKDVFGLPPVEKPPAQNVLEDEIPF